MMIKSYRPSDDELMEMARAALARAPAARAAPQSCERHRGARPLQRQRPLIGFNRASKVSAAAEIHPAAPRFLLPGGNLVPPPAVLDKPPYGTVGYAIAFKAGWITAEEEKADRLAYMERRQRSLQSCHRFSLYERPRHAPPQDSGAFVPELSKRLEKDRNLTDGARRCARIIAADAYMKNREGRCVDITVTYLMKAMGRCRRTVQRYLRLLEREGYITVNVVGSPFSRMCVGLVIYLKGAIFARHHRKKWPDRKPKSPLTLRTPGATPESQNKCKYYSLSYFYRDKRMLIPRHAWALRCMDGVYRQVMKTIPPFPGAA